MSMTALFAHYDSKKICLDEPYNLKPNAKLIVTVLNNEKIDDEHKAWHAFSDTGINQAYSDE